MEIKHPRTSRIAFPWKITYSHLVDVPTYIQTFSLNDLKAELQRRADSYKGDLAFGELSYKYETDDEGYITKVHSSFINKHGKPQRFIRLERP